MPRGVKKENLPTKVCVVCGRPFTWRKKWERVWAEVTTCSKSCNRKRKILKSRESSCTLQEPAGDALDAMAGGVHDITELIGEQAILTEEEEVNALTKSQSFDDESQSSQNSSTSNDSNIINEQQFPRLTELIPPTIMDAKTQRKAEKKRKKAERRAQREGNGDPTAGQKQCTLCSKSVNLLIRCTHDESGKWGMVCGKCWNNVSGGVVDGDDAHPHYRYGGLWKNRRAQI
ncbi:hypothetical protein ACHAXR_008605 [Thalassiosira sp. AJA248-18]